LGRVQKIFRSQIITFLVTGDSRNSSVGHLLTVPIIIINIAILGI
jgi:hypothetical protein